MPFHRRRGTFSLAQKNIFQEFASAIAPNVVNISQIVNASGAADGISAVDFPCTIKAIHLDLSVLPDVAGAITTQSTVVIFKSPANSVAVPIGADLTAQGNSVLASYIIWSFQGANPTVGTPVHRFFGWIKIPRRFQIFNEGDLLRIASVTSAVAHTRCTRVVYKWRQ